MSDVIFVELRPIDKNLACGVCAIVVDGADHCGGLVLVYSRRLLDVSKRKLKRRVGTMYNYYIITAVCNTAIGGTAVGPGGGREETVEGSPGSEWGVDTGTSVYLQHYDNIIIKHSYAYSIIKCRRRRWVIIITASAKQEVAPRLYIPVRRGRSPSHSLSLFLALLSGPV